MTQPYGQQPQEPGQGQPSSNPQQQPSTPQQRPPQQGQPGYGQQNQPGYGQQNQPGYGQQNYAPQGYPPGAAATTKGRPNVAGLVFAVIAAVLGILSLFVFGWYRKNYSSVSGGAHTSTSSKFHNVHDVLTQLQNAIDAHPGADKLIHLGVAPIYFSWLGYLLILAAVALAIIASLPTGGLVMLFKVLTAIVSLAGIAITLWAINLFSLEPAARSQVTGGTPTSYGAWLKHTSFGAWAMGLAFLLCLIAALIPPKRVAVLTEPAGRY
ncbi:MAG TPA: hypothetical protein VIG48_06670 [Jatrophihabitans sp.]|jgi:hypothetical protein